MIILFFLCSLVTWSKVKDSFYCHCPVLFIHTSIDQPPCFNYPPPILSLSISSSFSAFFQPTFLPTNNITHCYIQFFSPAERQHFFLRYRLISQVLAGQLHISSFLLAGYHCTSFYLYTNIIYICPLPKLQKSSPCMESSFPAPY